MAFKLLLCLLLNILLVRAATVCRPKTVTHTHTVTEKIIESIRIIRTVTHTTTSTTKTIQKVPTTIFSTLTLPTHAPITVSVTHIQTSVSYLTSTLLQTSTFNVCANSATFPSLTTTTSVSTKAASGTTTTASTTASTIPIGGGNSSSVSTPSSTTTASACPTGFAAGTVTEGGSDFVLSCATSVIPIVNGTDQTLSEGPTKTFAECLDQCDSLGSRCQALMWHAGYCTTYQWAMATQTEQSVGAAYATRPGALPLQLVSEYIAPTCATNLSSVPASFNLYAKGSANTTYNGWCMNASDSGFGLVPTDQGCSSFKLDTSSNELFVSGGTDALGSQSSAASIYNYGLTHGVFASYKSAFNCVMSGCYLDCSYAAATQFCQIENDQVNPASYNTIIVPSNFTTYTLDDNSYVCEPFSLSFLASS